MPAEVRRGTPYHGGPVDIWAIGIFAFIFVTGCPPLEHAVPRDWWWAR